MSINYGNVSVLNVSYWNSIPLGKHVAGEQEIDALYVIKGVV